MSAQKSTYTLQLVDNTKDLKLAIDNIRRVNVQLSGKMIGSQQLRAGIYDLLQKVRGKGKDPITSNLPSESKCMTICAANKLVAYCVLCLPSNHSSFFDTALFRFLISFWFLMTSLDFALGRGSKRLAGTGRTAGIKARKLEQQGVAGSANAAKNILVGEANKKRGPGGGAEGNLSDLTFLKNALGNEIAFCVEKGGGARANLLSQRHPNPNRKRQKLMDAAATRVGVKIPLDDVHLRTKKEERDRREKLAASKRDNVNVETSNDKNGKETSPGETTKASMKNGGLPGTDNMDWLNNNISREELDLEMARLRQQDMEQGNSDSDHEHEDDMQHHDIIFLPDETDDFMASTLWDDDIRKSTFQALYAKEMARQALLLRLENDTGAFSSPPKGACVAKDNSSVDEKSIGWEDG
jgi:hypothetical protein